MPRTLQAILESPKVTHQNKVTKLLDGKPTFDELIIEAYNLGQAISDDNHSEKLRDYEATVKGLYDALEAKNDVSITVITKGDKWIPFLVLSLLIILILISIIYARP